jgi:peptide/nickel transport system permease protein
MARFIVRRTVAAIGVLLGVVTVTFFAVSASGGDQVDAILGPTAADLPGLRQQVVAEYGLNKPLIVQYADRLGSLLSGNLGWSYQENEPVARLLGSQAMPTLELATSAAITSVALALLITIATAGRNRILRGAVSLAEVLAVAVPSFWLGIVLLTVFSFQLHWFPSFGAQGAASLVLPTLALALPIAGVLAQVLRRELELAESRPFALSARARGLSPRALLVRHSLRHALLPLVTMSAWILGSLISGAVLVEQVFSRPGLGSVLVNAVQHRDTPVVTAVVTIAATVFVVANTIADVLYPVIDARLREPAAA